MDKQELSALHYAVRYGHLDVIKLLIENKADVNIVGADGAQPIHLASKYFKADESTDNDLISASSVITDVCGIDNPMTLLITDVEKKIEKEKRKSSTNEKPLLSKESNVINFLLDHGASVNACDLYCQTPLHYAACKGNAESIKILLKCPEVNLCLTDTSGGSVLHSACGNGRADVVRLLLKAGAQLMVWDNEHQTPLHHASAADEEGAEVLREIIAFAKEQGGCIENWKLVDMVNDQDNEGESILHMAVDLGNIDVCRTALENGSLVNLCRNNFGTPLHKAATTGDIEIVKLLVHYGADLEAQDITGETPLHKASNYTRVTVIKYLLEKGCDIDVTDQDNTTPLIMASYNGGSEAAATVKLLLNHKADISAVDSSDRTAIYWAAQENAIEVVKVLLNEITITKCQYLIEQTDRYDNTPLHIAAEKGFKNVVQMLIDHHADVECSNDEDLTPLHLAAINGNKKVAIALLNKQQNIINDEDESGNTALHLAAINGHPKLVDLFVDFGAGVDSRNNLLWTPLDCAAARGHTECVLRLIDRDSPIDPMDLAKTTPLHLASREGHSDVVKTLLENGADVTIVNHEGRNALDMAIENSQKEVALTILDHKDWLQAVQNRLRFGKNISTPMRQLIKKLPSVAFVLLNKCMKLTSFLPEDSEDYQVTFFYDLIDDTYADWSADADEVGDNKSTTKSATLSSSASSDAGTNDANRLTDDVCNVMEKIENHPLILMSENKCDKLLSHPLVLSLIYQKWQKFGRVVFYLKFSLYFIFLFFFTGLILVSVPLLPQSNRVNATYSTCTPRATKADKEKLTVIIFFTIGRILVLALGFVQLILEIPQLILRRFNYIADLANSLEWAIYILAIVYAWHGFDHLIDPSQHKMDCTEHISVGSIGIFFAWINLILFIRKFPTLGIYVVMFIDVTKTFLKFSVTFILFVVSFALGFFTLLEGKIPLTYDNIGRTFVKTLVMMIGEFDFDNLFNEGVYPPTITWLLFVVFVIIMTILLMNLMVGLAVDDIKSVLDQATMTRITMQVQLVMDVEKTLPRSFRRRYIMHSKTVYPNKEFAWYKNISHITTMSEIESVVKPKKTMSDLVQEQTQSIRDSVEKLKKNSQCVGKQLRNMEKMMEKLLVASNIVEDEDDN